ncbi:MAG: hypothetical protein ABSB40_03690 [Nitrososphaeria archaeon]|jgi:hypothetical protein
MSQILIGILQVGISGLLRSEEATQIFCFIPLENLPIYQANFSIRTSETAYSILFLRSIGGTTLIPTIIMAASLGVSEGQIPGFSIRGADGCQCFFLVNMHV